MTQRKPLECDDDFPLTIAEASESLRGELDEIAELPPASGAANSSAAATRASVQPDAPPKFRGSSAAALDAPAAKSKPVPLRAEARTLGAAAAAAASETPPLRLVVRGFSAVERSLLDSTVKHSQRRTPRLKLLADSQLQDADVVMINSLDARAMDWARRQPVLASKAVIWVDGSNPAPGHIVSRRPVQWPILPVLLARALAQGPGTPAEQRGAPSAKPAGNDSPPCPNHSIQGA